MWRSTLSRSLFVGCRLLFDDLGLLLDADADRPAHVTAIATWVVQ
jgi:hypothetical protein